MFGPFPDITAPFKYGHGLDYWLTGTEKVRVDNVATEVFAEMFSASIAKDGSLEQIKRFFPRAYDIFLEMLEVINDNR